MTLYVDRQAPVLVGQQGVRNFLSESSVLPVSLLPRLAAVAGVARVAAIAEEYAMLRLHGRRVVALLVGFDAGRAGGPWALASGRQPRNAGELVLDGVVAGEHGFGVGDALLVRGMRLRVVGLSAGTSGFMTPLAFTTRATVNALDRQPGTATFFLVWPREGATASAVVGAIERGVPGVTALLREDAAAADRRLFVGAFSGPLRAMVAIAAVVGLLVVGLTSYVSTRDRTREYATLKAVGLRRGAALRLAVGEAAVVSLAGAAVGAAAALAVQEAVNAFAPKYFVSLALSDVGLVVSAGIVMAAAAALIPARYVARLSPASAFRL